VEIRQAIRIAGNPFPKPLPLPLEVIQNKLAQHGFLFADMGNNRVTTLEELYVPHRLSEIEKIVEAEQWDVKVTRSVWPVFDDRDFQLAPLWSVYFTDLWIDEIDFSSVCDECGRKRIHLNTCTQVSEVKSRKPLLSVNGQIVIVAAKVKAAIDESLLGACFHPFDEQERYFYLGAEGDVGPLVIRENEVIDYQGNCSRCLLPKFKTYFGPLRYAKTFWSGEDIVRESFHDGYLFTPKAYNLLRKFDQTLSRGGIALLE